MSFSCLSQTRAGHPRTHSLDCMCARCYIHPRTERRKRKNLRAAPTVVRHHKARRGERQNTGGNCLRARLRLHFRGALESATGCTKGRLHHAVRGLPAEASDVKPRVWSRRARLHPNIFLRLYIRRRAVRMGCIPHSEDPAIGLGLGCSNYVLKTWPYDVGVGCVRAMCRGPATSLGPV